MANTARFWLAMCSMLVSIGVPAFGDEVDVFDFRAPGKSGADTYVGTYLQGGIVFPVQVTGGPVYDDPTPAGHLVGEHRTYTLGASWGKDTRVWRFDADSWRPITYSGESPTSVSSYTYTEWPRLVPRIMQIGQSYPFEDRSDFVSPSSTRSIRGTGTATIIGIESVQTAVATFECIHLRIVRAATDIATGARVTSNDDYWLARGFGIVRFTEYTRGTTGLTGERDFTLASTNRSVVALPALPGSRPPKITSEPSDRVVNLALSTDFRVAASGSEPLTYQWRRNGVDIPGANGAVVIISPGEATDGDRFSAVVSNPYGTATTREARLSYYSFGPTITVQPQDAVLPRGGSVILTATATGSGMITYQWYLSGVAIPGATSSSYTASAPGLYSVVVHDRLGSKTSRTAVVSLAPDTDPPRIVAHPLSQPILPGRQVTLQVTAESGVPMQYQWSHDGAPIAGATNASLTTDAPGAYVVAVSNTNGATTSAAAVLTSLSSGVPARIVNLSSRAIVSTGPLEPIAGFVIGGSDTRQVLLRGIGPTLFNFGVSERISHARLTLRNAGGSLIRENNAWDAADTALAAATQAVGAFALSPGSKDAAFLSLLEPGAYTATLSAIQGSGGVGLVEMYDVSGGATPLMNLSTRAMVANGSQILIGGLVVEGAGSVRLLARAVGPGLSAFGVQFPHSDPELTIRDATGAVVVFNDDWNSADTMLADSTRAVGAFPLAVNSRDAALVISLPAGAYTAQVTVPSGTAGVALLEFYVVP